jgi:hypothetical protein
MFICMLRKESGGHGPSAFFSAFRVSTRSYGPGIGGLQRIGNVYQDTVNTEATAH